MKAHRAALMELLARPYGTATIVLSAPGAALGASLRDDLRSTPGCLSAGPSGLIVFALSAVFKGRANRPISAPPAEQKSLRDPRTQWAKIVDLLTAQSLFTILGSLVPWFLGSLGPWSFPIPPGSIAII